MVKISRTYDSRPNPNPNSTPNPKQGRITLNKEITEDDLLEIAIEAGCDGDATVRA